MLSFEELPAPFLPHHPHHQYHFSDGQYQQTGLEAEAEEAAQ